MSPFYTMVKAIFVTVIVVIIIAIIILLIVVSPVAVNVTVESASLKRFDLNFTDPKALYFDLATNITLHNPNRRMGIYYDRLESEAYYDGAMLGDTVTLPTFYMGHKITTSVSADFRGQTYYDGVEHYNWENWTGWFHVDLWVYSKRRYKIGRWVMSKSKAPKLKCELALRLVANGSMNTGFSSTRCGEVVKYTPSNGGVLNTPSNGEVVKP